MRVSTLSGNSSVREASNDAHDASGDSRVPRRASVRIETLRSGFARRECRISETSSCSVFPMYNVDKNILLFAFRIMLFSAV